MATMSARAIRRLVLIGAGPLSFVITLAIASALPPTASGQGSTYSYSSEQLGDGSYLVYVDLLDTSYNFTSYKTENDARISAWSGNPTAAPSINAQKVLLTFTSPMSYASVVQLISPHANNPGSTTGAPAWVYHLAGRTAIGNEILFMKSESDFDPSIIGVPQLPPVEVCQASPNNCEGTTYSGIIAVEFDVAGGAASLQTLKNHGSVFLVDTTGIQIRHVLSQSNPSVASNIQLVSLPEPEQDDVHGHVTIP